MDHMNTPGRTLVLVLIVVLAVGLVALAGPALASSSTVETAERSAEIDSLSPGETTTITVDVELADTDDLFVVEEFDPAVENLEIVDDDGAFVSDSTDAGDELFAEWQDVDSVTLLYEVTIPDDAEDGDTYTIESGESGDVDIEPLTLEVDAEPAFFSVSDLQPGDTEVDPGETIDISASVTNVGESSGEQTLSLAVDSDTVDTQAVTLGSEESETVTFEDVEAPSEAGTYMYTVASEDDERTAQLDVGDTDVAVERIVEDSVVPTGGSTTVTVVAESAGEDPGVFEQFDPAFDAVEITDDGGSQFKGVNDANDELFAAWNGTFDEVAVEYEVTVSDEPGEHELTGTFNNDDGDVEIGPSTIEVTDEEIPKFEIASLETASTVSQGDSLSVTVDVTNTGGAAGTQQVTQQITDVVTTSEELELQADEIGTVELAVDTTALDPGPYEQTVSTEDDSETVSLDVEYSSVTYATDDGTVDIQGVSDAIDDWRTGEIGLGLLQEVIEHWRSGEPVQ